MNERRTSEHAPSRHTGIGHFQAITLRLIAERLLPDAAGQTYVLSELISQRLGPLPKPKKGHINHVYCSKRNPGAVELMTEVATELRMGLRISKAADKRQSRVPAAVETPKSWGRPKDERSALLVVVDADGLANWQLVGDCLGIMVADLVSALLEDNKGVKVSYGLVDALMKYSELFSKSRGHAAEAIYSNLQDWTVYDHMRKVQQSQWA